MTAHPLLLAHMSEAEWADQVKTWARRGNWCGYHLRRSRGVLEAIHTAKRCDHDDALGIPDWLLMRPGSPLLLPELKTERGRFQPGQERYLRLLSQATGVLSEVWRPSDGDRIEALLTGGTR